MKLMYGLISSFNFLPMSLELQDLVMNNCCHILRRVIGFGVEVNDLKAIFKKISFIGRKIMLNINEAFERLETI